MELQEEVVAHARSLDVPLIGFAPAERWETPLFEPWVPEAFWPASIVPGTRTVIVIGFPVFSPVLDSAPSIWYHELYQTINTLLDTTAYRLAARLSSRGHPSVPIPRDGYGSIRVLLERPTAFFSHRHAAYLAGLGTFGTNNMLLTPEYGPRVRFTSIFTTAELSGAPVMETGLCLRCMRCVETCPSGALDPGDYPGTLTQKRACTEEAASLYARQISPCGRCLAVCPVGEDRWPRPGSEAARAHIRSYGGL